VEALATRTASEVLAELLREGYTLDVKTRVEAHDHKVGAQAITYADKLLVLGDEPLTPDLRVAVREHRDELLAAACVIRPPEPWLRILVERHGTSEAVEVKRDGWNGPYRVRLAMLAANVAAFIGLHPAHDGPRLEPIIGEVLKS
jgi:hypothetical protein